MTAVAPLPDLPGIHDASRAVATDRRAVTFTGLGHGRSATVTIDTDSEPGSWARHQRHMGIAMPSLIGVLPALRQQGARHGEADGLGGGREAAAVHAQGDALIGGRHHVR